MNKKISLLLKNSKEQKMNKNDLRYSKNECILFAILCKINELSNSF